MTRRFLSPASVSLERVVRIALALSMPAVASCSLVNAIDVCDRAAPSTHEVNQRTEGAQAVSGAQPVAALATGGALVVFRSAVAADDDGDGASAIRIAVLDSAGRPAERTCDAAGENELLAPVAGTRFEEASLAMPGTSDEEVGLVVFSSRTASAITVRGVFVSQTGCARALLLAAPDFAISDLADASPEYAATPSVVWLGNATFLVAWNYARITAPDVRSEVRVRVVRSDLYRPEFPPTMRDGAGASVPILETSSVVGSGRADALGSGRAALSWNEALGRRIIPNFMVVDDRLATVVSARAVDGMPPVDTFRLPTAHGSAAAFDGHQIFVTWTQITADGNTRVKGRYFDEAGASLRSPLSPDGAPFILRDDVAPEDEGRVALAPLDTGGFLAGMEQFGGTADRFQSLAARLFGPDGAPAFANAACDARSFQLAASDGDLSEPALARLANGSVLLAYTSDGATGNDHSGSGVRATVFAPRDLLPIP